MGHETDVTLVDFTGDCRVATPTAAAERVMPPLADLEQSVVAVARRLQGALALRAGAAPSSHIGYLYPAGGQAGSTVEVVVGGRALWGINSAYAGKIALRADLAARQSPGVGGDVDTAGDFI